MRVLFANKFFFPKGGSEVVMFQERDYLLSIGVEVVDFSMTDPRNAPSRQSDFFTSNRQYAGTQRLSSRLKSALTIVHSREATKKIDHLIRLTKPDLVHCHSIYHQLTPSIIGAAKRHKMPVVLTLHDYKPVCPVYTRLRNGIPCSLCLDGGFGAVVKHRCAGGSLGKSVLLYGEAVLQKLLQNYERVDRFLAPSRFMLDSVLHRFDSDRVSLLYNGVDVDARPRNHLEEGYVLYFGRLSGEKGIDTLLQAQRLHGASWDVRIAGTGPIEEALRQRYPTATFLGHLTGEQLREALRRASIVVVPSQWYENCPMSVLEAMACAKPVVGSRIGGIPELIIDNETGLLFESGDTKQLAAHINLLLGDSRLRRTMGEAAHHRAKIEFSLRKHCQTLINVYESLL